MSDPLDAYEICVKRLVKDLDKQHHLTYNDADIYKMRLLENICLTRLHGDTRERKADRSEILARLSGITREVFDKSFDEYCESDNSSSSKPPSTGQIADRQAPAQESGYIQLVLAVAEKASEMFSEGIWETRCERIRQSFLAIGKPSLFKGNTSISSFDIHLSSITSEVDELVKLLAAFCPVCEMSTQPVKRQSQAIQSRLKQIIRKCRTQ